MSDPTRFIDNQDGSCSDTQTALMWTLEDAWQKEAQWYNWDEAKDWADDINFKKFCSFQDWRLPTEPEIRTLYNPEEINKDKYEKDIYLETIFPAGSQATLWLKGDSGHDGTLFDFKDGTTRPLYKSKSGRMSVRLVRGTMV